MSKNKRGVVALAGVVVMLVLTILGSIYFASNSENSVTGALIGIQEFEGSCNISIKENINNIGHDYLCNGTDGFHIDASNIVFDCQNHFIKCIDDCNGSAGVRVTAKTNVTIKNCYIYNFSDGIRLEEATSSSLLYSNYLYNNTDGIDINNATSNNVTRNLIDNSSSCGINVSNMNNDPNTGNNRIWDNKIWNNSGGFEACNDIDSRNFWFLEKNCGAGAVNILGFPCLGGNNWLSYTGKDLTGDGLGDQELPYKGGNILTTTTNGSGDFYPLVDPCSTIPGLISENVTCPLTEINSTSGEGYAITKSNIVFTCNGTILNGNVNTYADDMRGIEIQNVHDVTVVGCEIYNFTYGVYIKNAYNINLVNMTIRDNNISGVYVGDFAYNITIEGNDIGNVNSTLQDYGVWFYSSKPSGGNSFVISNNIFNNTIAGVYLSDTSDTNTISSNNIFNNKDGVLVSNSDGNNIYNNIISNNSGTGINVQSSTISELGSSGSTTTCLDSCTSAYTTCPDSCDSNLLACPSTCDASYSTCTNDAATIKTNCYATANSTYTTNVGVCSNTFQTCYNVTCLNSFPDINQTNQLSACQNNCTIESNTCNSNALSTYTAATNVCDAAYTNSVSNTSNSNSCISTNTSCYSACDTSYGSGCTATCQATYDSCNSGCNSLSVNTIYGNVYGYYLNNSLSDSDNGVTGIIYNNTFGIYFQNSTPNIQVATLYQNTYGIIINRSNPGSGYIKIDDVIINGSLYGLLAQDSLKLKLSSQGYNQYSNNSYGIYLNNVNNSIFTSDIDFGEGPLNLSNNTNSLILLNSHNNLFDYLTIFGGAVGINLTNSNQSNFTNNHVTNTTSLTLQLTNSNNNIIYNNYFTNASGTLVQNNNGDNVWNRSYNCSLGLSNIIGALCWGGNYWSTYSGADIDGDSIGDTLIPFNITNSTGQTTGTDSLPLTNNLAGCGNISQSVVLVQNISQNGTCFNVVAENITLDFAGHYLMGNGSGYGIYINSYSNVAIINATITNFSTAIYADPASNITVSYSNFDNNTKAISFLQINNSLISNNQIINNTYGIELVTSPNNTLYHNNLTMNEYGLTLSFSVNNSIFDNYFNNTIQNAQDDGINYYNSSYATTASIIGGTHSGGNFWSDYLGRDTGSNSAPYNLSGDGIGDTNIPYSDGLGVNGDYLPLTLANGTIGPENCLTITSSTKLSDDVTCSSGDGVTINSNSVTLDCNNKNIIGGGVGSGILINNKDNIVVKNCNITDFYYGIKVLNSDNIQIIENNRLILNDFYGIYLYGTTNVLINNNSMINDNNGVYMISAQNTSITNNVINLQKKFYGVYAYESVNNTISNNEMWDNYHGIYLVDSDNTNASYNRINDSDVYSVFVHKETTGSLFNFNNLTTGLEAIRIKQASNYNNFSNNVVTNHQDYGIYATNSANNLFVNNTLINNSNNIYLYNSTSYTLRNNSVSASTTGIVIVNQSNSLSLINNTVNSTTYPSLEINDSESTIASGNKFYNSAVLNNVDSALFNLNNTILSNFTINESDSLTIVNNNLQYVHFQPTSLTNFSDNTLTQLNAVQFVSGWIGYNTIANQNITALNLQLLTNSYVYGNNIQNTTTAILFSNLSNGNQVYDNWLKNNLFGLNITGSYNNKIYNNYFSNGVAKNVYDNSANTWNASYVCGVPNIIGGPCKGGNFYSDYYGLDNGANNQEQGDGVGDQPSTYTVTGTTYDYSPLVLYVARQYFDQVSPYNITFDAYGNLSELLIDGHVVPNSVQTINFTSSNKSYARFTALFNQSNANAQTLKTNITANKTAINKSGITGFANAYSVYVYHNYEFDAGVYICQDQYNLSLDQTCTSVVNLTSIGTTGAYSLSHSNGYYLVENITNNSVTVGINKNGYCGANILHDVTLTSNASCNGSAFIVKADNITIDFAGYSLTGNGSGIGINSSDFDNIVIKNANIKNFSTAIYVDPAVGINITNGSINNNNLGIYFSRINNSFITSNLIWNNTVGINLSDSYNNSVFNNYFSNTNDAVDNGNNTYYVNKNTSGTNILMSANNLFSLGLTINSTFVGGNYWSNYSGWDTTPDGFGDTLLPYNNSGQINNSGDIYPLTGIGYISCGGTTQNVTTNITLVSDLTTSGTCFTITSDNITFDCDGHSLTGDGLGADYGIYALNRNGVVIQDCILTNFSSGLLLYGSNNTIVDGITAFNNTAAGISIAYSHNNNLSDIYSYNNTDNGINLNPGNNNHFENVRLVSFSDSGNNGILLVSNSNSNVFENITISSGLTYGVYLGGNNSVFTNVTILNNLRGFFLTGAYNNSISSSTVRNSSVGINLTNSYNNTIYNDYFNNTVNVQDDGSNYWNTSYDCSVSDQNILGEDCLGGNFWSDYNGTDNGTGTYPHNISGDGVGDVPSTYNITNSSSSIKGYDYLPLMVAAVCGNGEIEGSEQCEVGSLFATGINTSCLAHGWNGSGTIGCDTSVCTILTTSTYCSNTTSTTVTPVTTGGGSGGGGGGGAVKTTAKVNCTENWQCGEWSECIGGKQTRNCNDANLCGSLKKSGEVTDIITKTKPSESRSCQMPSMPVTQQPAQPIAEQEQGIISAVLPEEGVARTITLSSLAALLVFGGVYASWYLSAPRNRLKRKLKQVRPLLDNETNEVLKENYLGIYGLYMKLAEKHKPNYYAKVTKLREKIEDQLKAEKKLQELLGNQVGEIKEQKEKYLQAYQHYQKLPAKAKQKYYPDLVNFREKLEKGKTS